MSHEFQGEAFSGDTETIEAQLTGAQYDGWPLKIFTVEDLLNQQGVCNYVWPYEGTFTLSKSKPKWKFHGGKVMDGKTLVDCPVAPLMVDASSAYAFTAVWNAINETNRAKTREFCNSRGLFVGLVMERLVWPNVGFNRN